MNDIVSARMIFKRSLYAMAAQSLQEGHPEYVSTIIGKLNETGDFEQALDAVKELPTDAGFSKWRPLLTDALDVELAIDQLKTSLKLLKVIPLTDVISNEGIFISQGSWIHYHLNAWIFWMDGLLERVDKLVKQTVRTLLRPNNPHYRLIESEILESVHLLSDKVGKVRDPLAHGGGFIEAPSEQGLWEGLVLILTLAGSNRDLNFDDICKSMVPFHARWYKFLDRNTTIVLARIEDVFKKFNTYLEWK